MKTSNKVLAISIIALLILAAILVPVNSLAANLTLTNGTIKVNNIGDRTVKLYKVFNIDSATDAPNYAYSFTTGAENYFASISKTNIIDAVEYVNSLANKHPALNTFALNIKGNLTEITLTNGEATNQTSGYYLLVEETSSAPEGSTISAAVLNNVVFSGTNTEYTVNLKVNSIAKPEKTVADNDANGAQVKYDSALPGELLTFTITQVIPQITDAYTAYEMNVIDTLPAGLTYDSSFTPTVKIGNTDFTSTFTVDTNTLTWKFNNITDLRNHAGETITITYKANVAENAAEVNLNSVKTTYTENPNAPTSVNGTTASDVVKIYCYKLGLSKKDATSSDLIDGAVFDITGPSGFSRTNVTVRNGNIELTGLKEGTYTLTEKTAPEGYTKLDKVLIFTITDGETTVAINKDATAEGQKRFINVEADSTDAQKVNVEVLNTKFGALPETGGMGTVIFTVVGIALMVTAGTVLVARNKRSQEN